jgi:hypothetical protein
MQFADGGAIMKQNGFVFKELDSDYKQVYQFLASKNINGKIYYFSRLNIYPQQNVFTIELEDGKEIGRATLNEQENYLINIRVNDKYRRKGLAINLYDFIEIVIGEKLKPSPDKISKEAKSLWVKRNNNIKMKQGGNIDKQDSVTMNIPLLIRTLELAREDVKSDAELHHIVENLLKLKNKKVLTMDDYDYIAHVKSKHISKMKDGVGIVNASRGGVIDEVALIDALDAKKVLFAGLDVFENEPTPEIKILMHPSISLTPHIGAATLEAQDRIGTELADQIYSILKN